MTTYAALLLLCFFSMLRASDSLSTEWLFQNSFEKEFVQVNEAVTVVPDELSAAFEFYKNGSYRRAADILYQIRRLNLPDGNLDFISFMLAECYRKLNLDARALREYEFVAGRFPGSDKQAPSLYRLLEYAAEEGTIEKADSIQEYFAEAFAQHPLYNSVLYLCGRLYFEQEYYDDAVGFLEMIPASSIRYYQAQFVTALSFVRAEEWDKAVTLLKKISKRAKDIDIKTEALIVIGDVHYKNNRVDDAIRVYRKVSKKSSRYEYAQVKIARCMLDLGFFKKAVNVANKFIEARLESDYFFEMASILEQAFESMRQPERSAEVGEKIHRQIISSRITFELYDELDRIIDIISQYELRARYAGTRGDTATLRHAVKAITRAVSVRDTLRGLLAAVKSAGPAETAHTVPHLAERRYIGMLKKSMNRLEDSVSKSRNALLEITEQKSENDSMAKSNALRARSRLKELEHKYRETAHEHELIISQCLGSDDGEKRLSEEMQVKFIDWEFMKYVDKKQLLVELLKKKNANDTTVSDSVAAGVSDSTDPETARKELIQSISDERDRLVSHIETMLDIYPKSRYAPGALYRLAELYYDRAGEEYRKKLARYEKMLLADNDSLDIPFPEYDLDHVLEMYGKIYGDFPVDRLADNALFYSALALKKQGMEDSAQTVLLNLIQTFPQSEYYMEANMNIGHYYFEHAKDFSNGYQLAEEAFRRVLYYRDHPQFVQALYHLGWCYYMQDKYEEAIAAFKYMIEQVDLEFDPFAKEEKEVKNPLLRSEAIDYLAISFDQDRNTDDAIEFFNMIGSEDYAALVLNRMGELREEDLDFEGAVATYRLLLNKYPHSLSAPEASVRLIKLYKNASKTAMADSTCDYFIRNFGPGSQWQSRILPKDSALVVRIDSMVIAIGLGIADNAYREAQKNGLRENYLKASEMYKRIVEKYPQHPGAADAAWNLAALLDDKLADKPSAYERFIIFSKYPGVDSTRREAAALNAIAIAQSLLLPDSSVRKGAVDFAGEKLITAVNNYTTLFSNGTSTAEVLFAMAGVYFNRNMYTEAAEAYNRIIDSKLPDSLRAEAMLLFGQCRFGEEKWQEAIAVFEKVKNSDASEESKQKAFAFLQQALFLDARALMQKEKYDAAADAFRKIHSRFPGGEYGDAALFNAAESYEKREEWLKACEAYFDLQKGYPSSKLAPEALFNAAGNFEKADKFGRAADAYEKLIAQYPDHEKAKDALFNVGFCYEKLGKIDEMTAANERYGMLYPGEKDVEALLLRSASYYSKTGMLDKAITLYKNFIRRYPQSDKSVEAYFQIGMIQYKRGDWTNALMNFEQAELQNNRIRQTGGMENDYSASEAAMYHGLIRQEQYSRITLEPNDVNLNDNLKEKSGLVASAVKDYERVMQYKSEKMFEAGCRIGMLYEDIAEALAGLRGQWRGDPIKAAIKENEYLTTASNLLQNSFIPYRKVLELSGSVDSLTDNQMEWVKKAKAHLENNLILAGTYLYEGVGAMQKAPVPREIEAKPLLYYQYKVKLLETLEPLKKKVLHYFSGLLDTLPQLHLDDSLLIVTELHVARLQFLIANAYDRLAINILNSTNDLPKNLAETEREDLLFQLEDIVYELQDNALFRLEDARQDLLDRKLEKTDWYSKILETLARLDPDKYGKSFFVKRSIKTDYTWICRGDTAAGWSTAKPPDSGWIRGKEYTVQRVRPGGARFIAGDTAWHMVSFWKHLFLDGKPRNARIGVNAQGQYRLYINEVLTMSDTVAEANKSTYDSLDNIESLLKGGDNIVACVVYNDSLTPALAATFDIMVDTTEQFTSTVKSPVVPEAQSFAAQQSAEANDSSTSAVKTAGKGKGSQQKIRHKKKEITRQDVMKQIEAYQLREREALAQLRKERLEIQKLRIRKSYRESQKKNNLPPSGTPSIPAPVNSN